MTPLIAGILLTFFTFLICGVEFVIHPFVKKWTNSYLFWLLIASFCLIYFLFTRYWNDWSNLIKYWKGEIQDADVPNPAHAYGWLKSRVYLTDLCPFFYVVILVSLIAQPSRKIAGYVSPILFFSGTLVFLSSIMLGDGGNAAFTFTYIFWGSGFITLKFFIHFVAVVLSLGVMLNTPNKKWKTFLWTNVWAVIFFIYISIVSYGFGVDCQVCYIRPADWEVNGDGYIITQLFQKLGINIPFPWIVFVPLVICYGFVSLNVCLQYILQKKTKWYAIQDKKVCGNIWLDGYYQMPNVKSNKKSR